jgi:hypothetical protein
LASWNRITCYDVAQRSEVPGGEVPHGSTLLAALPARYRADRAPSSCTVMGGEQARMSFDRV